MNKKELLDAEVTVRHAILSGIVDVWDKQEDPNFPALLTTSIYESILQPDIGWALKLLTKEEA